MILSGRALRLAPRESCCVDMNGRASGVRYLYQGKICENFTGEASKWIGFCLCPNWCIVKCAHLTEIKYDYLHKINWVCTPCLHKAYLATNTVEKWDEFKQQLSPKISRALSVKELSDVVD